MTISSQTNAKGNCQTQIEISLGAKLHQSILDSMKAYQRLNFSVATQLSFHH